LYLILLPFALVSTVRAADVSSASQFLGSPLLALVALIVIDAIAFLYHKIRK
jgi:predicted permease